MVTSFLYTYLAIPYRVFLQQLSCVITDENRKRLLRKEVVEQTRFKTDKLLGYPAILKKKKIDLRVLTYGKLTFTFEIILTFYKIF